ncbi:MAG: flagellar hook-associated protein FlgL [Aliarcobacter sp.]|nr:flagellar hook-associated protein FlgL [Aliarcobacter sp.]
MINRTEQMISRLSTLNLQEQKNSYQMSTGRKLQNGSDDSVLYAREVFINDKIRTYEGLKSQVEKTSIQNNIADSSMSEIKKILEFMKAELIKANTATTTEDGITAIAANISGLKENLYQLANTQAEGEYVFAGSDSSVRPFEKDLNGNIKYVGNSQLRRVAVEEDSYRERGITGFDMMMYASSVATKGETLTFKETDRIIDQNGNEWKLNSPVNNTLTKYDLNGNITAETITPITNDSLTPPTYSADSTIMPTTDGTRFEAKTNVFSFIDDTVNALKKVDNLGNPISSEESRAQISKNLGEIDKVYDGLNVAHAELGGKNKVFEVSLERITSKLTQYNILDKQIGAADLTKVAMEAKALELTYTALYSTINRTNQLSLVNFLN